MSSRALRKLQREREEQEQARALQEENAGSDDDSSSIGSRPAPNAFQMLNEDDEEDGPAEDAGADADADEARLSEGKQDLDAAEDQSNTPVKKAKKKKKKKAKNKAPAHQTEQDEASGLDEIDQALQSLATKDHGARQDDAQRSIDEANAQLYRLLSVEAKHLIAINEMKRLFGNVVLENSEDEPAAPSPRRRGRGPQNLDLGTALTARHSPVSKGQGLKGLALRRNPLMLGKEEWPQATSGGLGMQMVEKMEDGTIEYRFTHNSLYQGLQREFEACVASMDPQRLITMLMFNPYHISTLLQVSEIAKQQGDHSVAGDLVERALFTFGRSVHSTFANALSQGKARLDFRRPENREFWLACWRYIKDLGQRGTWRTAFEWAKLVLGLDPEGDPYCVTKIIDQLAIRGGQSEQFLALADHPFFNDDIWKHQPNIHISRALAQYRLKQVQQCRQTLKRTIHDYPWIFARLYQELNLPNLPKVIWGKQPRTDREKFDMEYYVLNAKDIWSLPDAISFLVEVCETTDPLVNQLHDNPPPNDKLIILDEARSTLLTNNPTLINLLPRELTTMPSRSSDPLPPPDDLPSYDPQLPPSPSEDPVLEAAYADLPPNADAAVASGPSGISRLFSRILPFLQQERDRRSGTDNDTPGPSLEARIIQAREVLQEMIDQIDSTPDDAPLGAPQITHADINAQRELLESLMREAGRPLSDAGGLRDPAGPIRPISPQEREFDDLPLGFGNGPPGWLPQDSDEEREARLGIPALGTPPAHTEDINSDSDSAPFGTPSQQQSPRTSQAALSPSGESQPTEQEVQARLQHWLAGQGIQGLKAYLTAHPLPAEQDEWAKGSGHALLHEYAGKLRQLRNTRTRDFLLKYALPQGTSKDIQSLIESLL